MEALIGAIIGAAAALIGSWFSTKYSTRAQMNAAVLSTVLPARLETYRQFEIAMEEWSKFRTQETAAAVYRAGNSVVLVASQSTVDALAPVLNGVCMFETAGMPINEKQFRVDHLSLLKAMNRDLMCIQAPRVEKSKEQDSKENQQNTTR